MFISTLTIDTNPHRPRHRLQPIIRMTYIQASSRLTLDPRQQYHHALVGLRRHIADLAARKGPGQRRPGEALCVTSQAQGPVLPDEDLTQRRRGEMKMTW